MIITTVPLKLVNWYLSFPT